MPQLGVSPPQPSAMLPQLAPSVVARARHDVLLPHVNGVPSPPPQTSGSAHDPQSSRPPQPSPIGPQVAWSEAHVTSPQGTYASGPGIVGGTM